MQITCNGNPTECADDASLDSVIQPLLPAHTSAAVAVNCTIIPSSLWQQTRLNAGDNIDIFTLVAGG